MRWPIARNRVNSSAPAQAAGEQFRLLLRARDRTREQALQLRAADWFEATGDAWHAAAHYLGAQQPDRALALMQDRVVPDFLHVPAIPEPPVLNMADPSMLAEIPERLLGLVTYLLLSGDTARGGQYLDLLEPQGQHLAGCGAGRPGGQDNRYAGHPAVTRPGA